MSCSAEINMWVCAGINGSHFQKDCCVNNQAFKSFYPSSILYSMTCDIARSVRSDLSRLLLNNVEACCHCGNKIHTPVCEMSWASPGLKLKKTGFRWRCHSSSTHHNRQKQPGYASGSVQAFLVALRVSERPHLPLQTSPGVRLLRTRGFPSPHFAEMRFEMCLDAPSPSETEDNGRLLGFVEGHQNVRDRQNPPWVF